MPYRATMTMIEIKAAEKDLAALIKRARAGEEIVIADAEGARVKLAPVEAEKPSYRGRGILKGKISASDEALFGPLPEEELKLWYGEK